MHVHVVGVVVTAPCLSTGPCTSHLVLVLVLVLVVTVSNWTTPSDVRPPMGPPFTPRLLTTLEWVMCPAYLALGTS